MENGEVEGEREREREEVGGELRGMREEGEAGAASSERAEPWPFFPVLPSLLGRLRRAPVAAGAKPVEAETAGCERDASCA
mgnify:CR=1 FL=1